MSVVVSVRIKVCCCVAVGDGDPPNLLYYGVKLPANVPREAVSELDELLVARGLKKKRRVGSDGSISVMCP
jgi:hypothetical protein